MSDFGLNENVSAISHQEIDQKICAWVASGPRHACAVEDKAFQDLILTLAPNYKVPSSMVISNMINARYFAEKSNLQRALLTAIDMSKISLSIGLVSDWLILSAYFITNIWTLTSHVIGCVRYNGAIQNGAAVAKWINDKLQDFGLLSTSIVAIVHYQEEPILSGVNMLAEAYGWHSLLCCQSVLCFVVDDVCLDQENVNAISKVEEVVEFFNQSEIAQKLIARAKSMSSDRKRNRSALDLIENLPAMKESLKDASLLKVADALMDALQPLDATLSYLKKNKFVPSSAIPVLLTGMEKKLSNEIGFSMVIKEELNSSTVPAASRSISSEKALKKKVLESLRNLTAFSANDVTTLAAALDPRYKKLSFISSDERQTIYSMISAECFFMCKDEPKFDEPMEENLPSKPCVGSCNTRKSSSSIMDDIIRLGSGSQDDEEHQDTNQEVLLKKIKKEMDIYFSEKPAANEINPFGWWRVNQTRFPILAKLARVYLCIPATAVISSKDFEASTPGICNHVSLCSADKLTFSL